MVWPVDRAAGDSHGGRLSADASLRLAPLSALNGYMFTYTYTYTYTHTLFVYYVCVCLYMYVCLCIYVDKEFISIYKYIEIETLYKPEMGGLWYGAADPEVGQLRYDYFCCPQGFTCKQQVDRQRAISSFLSQREHFRFSDFLIWSLRKKLNSLFLGGWRAEAPSPPMLRRSADPAYRGGLKIVFLMSLGPNPSCNPIKPMLSLQSPQSQPRLQCLWALIPLVIL